MPSGAQPAPLSDKVNILWNSVGSLSYLACQWLITIFVVRLSDGYDAAGILSLAMSVVGVFSTFANYKMGTYQISDINHENTLGEYLGFRALTLGIAFVACMVYALFTVAPYVWATVALYFLFKAIGLLIDICHGTDQQHRRMDYIGKSYLAQGVLTLAAFVAVFWLTQDINASIVAMTVAALAVLLLYDRPKVAQFERVEFSLSRKKAWYFLKVSFPAVVASLAASAIFTVPKQYLAFAAGEAALGIYSSVSAPALIIQMGATYLYNPFLDVFPRLYFSGSRREFLKLLARTVGAIVLVAIACSIVLEFMGSWVLQLLFGESIAPYVYLLQPVILATVLTAFLWFIGDLLITLRDFKAYFISNVAALIAVVPLSFVLVNQFDMNGVSFASAAACFAGVALLLVFLAIDMRRCKAPERKVDDKGEGAR
ncbi:MAG TPA: oligosaccharide flippase family protein [Candidatus Aphodovivens excrementavium]|nr:oligosaccharide flippase family protein [Candidatus Aphodovivens excrementavium]